MKVKIIDFGLGARVEEVTYKRCGTMHYMAPELIKKKIHSTPVDIWSTGILMYKLFKLGKHPFLNESLSRAEIINVMK